MRLALFASACGISLLALVSCKTWGKGPGPVEPVEPPEAPGLTPGTFRPPEIVPPRPETRRPLDTDPSYLPPGARARLPAFDGGSLFVTFPATTQAEVLAEDVFAALIQPILLAVGYGRGAQGFRMPPATGVELERADLAGLAEAVETEYAVSPELLRPRTRTMIDAMAGRIEADAELDRALKMGEGMSFSQYVAAIERLQIQFPFLQVEGDVPIEHTLLLATRWEGQNVTAVRGTVLVHYRVVNERSLSPGEALRRAVEALAELPGMSAEQPRYPGDEDRPSRPQLSRVRRGEEDEPVLVLLPYGSDADGTTRLRYAFRMIVPGTYQGQLGAFQLWLDASSGEILQLIPLIRDAGARGEVYSRDPDIGVLDLIFTVDGAVGGQYTLEEADTVDRVDFQGDGYNATDVSISDTSGSSTPTFADFDQSPLDDEAAALCQAGTNEAFQQISAYGWLNRYIKWSRSLGVFTPFPRLGALGVTIEWDACNGWNDGFDNLTFGFCDGYEAAGCPDAYTAAGDWIGDLLANSLATAQDNTWLAHELAHSLTPRLTNLRPADWCGLPACTMPLGWGTLHDLADFWADHFENTNCWSGWFAKNIGSAGGSLHCATSHEDGLAPRAHELGLPFDPADPLDHFPEHRPLGTTAYSDMQIGAAALWQVRLGMRSKCRPSGLPQFAVRATRALKNTTFFPFPGNTDEGIHTYLRDLETELVDEWATSGSPGGAPAFAHNGPHTTNKVTAGFARAGVFLTDGGDAVIDIDDGDTGDDLVIHGVAHPEVDFLELGGPAPTLHVWTGRRYGFDGAGAATFANPAPCHARYRVEVSTDPLFAPGSTEDSGWIIVDVDPTTLASPECYGAWQPEAPQWTALQAGGPGTLLYYRVRTRDAADLNERISTQPGNGLWTVDPPYAVITSDGQSDY
jgi:hypothetical protein